MGTQTYGKGTVQSSIDLNSLVNRSLLQRLAALVNKGNTTVGTQPAMPQLGLINLTMAKFYRVNGSSTQHKGVIPDIVFPSVFPMDKIGEDTEPSALPWDEIQRSNYSPVYDLKPVRAELVNLHNERMKSSLEYKMLQQEIIDMKKRDKETSVSLNINKLKAERDSLETAALARTNKLRESRGLPAVKKGDKIKKEEAFDFMENETLMVMADLIQRKPKQ